MKMTEKQAERKSRILISVYSSSMGLSLIALSVAVALEIFMLAYSFIAPDFYGPYLARYRSFYLSLMVVAVIAIALSCYVKKDIPKRFKILNYLSPVYAVFLFGWALAVTYSDYSVTRVVDPTVFMTFSLIVPLSVFLYPSVYAAIVAVANTTLIILAVSAAGGPGQLINIIIFIVFQVVLGVNFLHIKVKLAERIVEEQDNAGIDVMTGFLNRRSYEEDLNGYLAAPIPDDLTYITIDINGLKAVNDQYGHDAGDKLIVGVARCIEDCFGDKGKAYRIGGDEYAVILTSAPEDRDAMLGTFEASMRSWSESNGIRLTASFGCVSASELPGEGITAIAKAADAKMYENKKLYHQMSGSDKAEQA